MAKAADSVIVLDGDSLTLADVWRVAEGSAQVALSPLSRARAEASYAQNQALLASGAVVYGVTTGVGDSLKQRVSLDRTARMQEALVQLCVCGSGPSLPRPATRALLLARANSLAKGYSAVRPVVIERIIDLLNADLLPLIPEQGSIGASGDLVPSAYLALALLGERSLQRRGQLIPAAQAWAELGREPLSLQAKEGLALLNGTPLMSGLAALTALAAERVAGLADLCTALCVEALEGNSGPFHPFIHTLKAHPGQARSAAHIRAWLAGSQLARSVAQLQAAIATAGQSAQRMLPVRIQDPYSLRCAPQCIGALYDTLDFVRPWIERELNSANDNPLYDPQAGEVHSGGNFAGFHMALAMDALKTAVASVADLLDRQFALLVDPRYSNGLPPNLAPPLPPEHEEAGIHHGFKTAQIALSSLAAEALSACMPLSAFSRSTECHNQDKVSMGAVAARRARDVVELSERCCAMHLLGLCQAAELRGATRLGQTRRAFQQIRAVSRFVDRDRPLDGDIQAVLGLIGSGALLGTAAADDESVCTS